MRTSLLIPVPLGVVLHEDHITAELDAVVPPLFLPV